MQQWRRWRKNEILLLLPVVVGYITLILRNVDFRDVEYQSLWINMGWIPNRTLVPVAKNKRNPRHDEIPYVQRTTRTSEENQKHFVSEKGVIAHGIVEEMNRPQDRPFEKRDERGHERIRITRVHDRDHVEKEGRKPNEFDLVQQLQNIRKSSKASGNLRSFQNLCIPQCRWIPIDVQLLDEISEMTVVTKTSSQTVWPRLDTIEKRLTIDPDGAPCLRFWIWMRRRRDESDFLEKKFLSKVGESSTDGGTSDEGTFVVGSQVFDDVSERFVGERW
jgi:hypothetical protein